MKKFFFECNKCGNKTRSLSEVETLLVNHCPNCGATSDDLLLTEYKPRKRAAAVVVDLPNYCPGCGARWASWVAADLIPLVEKFNGGGVVACLACGMTVKKAV